LVILADNDIILKLSQLDLIDGIDEMIGEAISQTYVTPTARYQLLPKKDDKALAKCGGNQATLDRLRKFMDDARVIPELRDTGLLEKMGRYPDINGGEAMLFLAAAENPGPLLFTGDRKALTALLNHQADFPSVYQALENKVITFESALLIALKRWGFAIVKQKMLLASISDGIFRLVLKPDMSQKDLEECLQSYSNPIAPLLAFRELIL